jgi:sec-independent protein translocase protein TatB
MFDVGFSELVVIAIVALVVIGPERLPKVARTAGHLLGRLQRYVNDVKSDINREMQLDELKKLQADVQESARNIERSVSTEMQSAQQALNQTAQGVAEEVKPLPVAEVPAATPLSAAQPPELAAPAAPAEPLPTQKV